MNTAILNEINALSGLKNAFSFLRKIMPESDITAGFEIKKYTHNQNPIVEFALSSSAGLNGSKWVFVEIESQRDIPVAVKKLLKKCVITTVEQCIRLKNNAHLDGGKA